MYTTTLDPKERTEAVGWLWAPENLKPLPPQRPERPEAKLVEAIRYIRQTAFFDQLDSREYPFAIVLQLLRQASHSSSDPALEYRRTRAYALAEIIVQKLVPA